MIAPLNPPKSPRSANIEYTYLLKIYFFLESDRVIVASVFSEGETKLLCSSKFKKMKGSGSDEMKPM